MMRIAARAPFRPGRSSRLGRPGRASRPDRSSRPSRAFGQILAIALFAAAIVVPLPAHAATDDVVSEANWILQLQVHGGVDNGLIEANVNSAYCVPYFSSVAASGLAAATRATGDPKYVNAAWDWLAWYAAHMDANGFITNYVKSGGRWQSNGKMDSTDGYAGAFLVAVGDAYNVSGDRDRLSALWPAVHKAVDAMIATDNGGWLTYAKPDWPQAYIMDNVEVYEGFRAVEYLAGEVMNDGALRYVAGQWTAAMPAAFETYWDASQGGYDAAIGFDGIRYKVDWSKLYPTATAQAWMLRTGLVSADRFALLTGEIDQHFPNWPTSGLDASIGWWPELIQGFRFGANPVRASDGMSQMGSAVVNNGRAWPYHVGNAGVLIMMMADTPDSRVNVGPDSYVKPGTSSLFFTGIPSMSAGGVATYECRVDGGAYGACISPYSVSGLGEGTHIVDIRARDKNGHVDPFPATYPWVIDATAPLPKLTGTPKDPGNASPVFSFGADDIAPPAIVKFTCSMDGGSFVPCGSPASFTLSSNGTHTFQLKARDPAGNVSAPFSFSWWADATPPDSTILSGPSGVLSDGNGLVFAFSGSDDQPAPVTYQCRLGVNPFAACTSPYSLSVPEGQWTFQVRSVDAVGNVDPTPATQSFIVDNTPPKTTITDPPPAFTNLTSATIKFTGSDKVGGSSMVWFQCSLDGAAWARCTSPITFRNLSEGTHAFGVRAVNVAGLVDPAPPEADWIIDLTAPDAQITTNDGAILFEQPPTSYRRVEGTVTDPGSGVGWVKVTFRPVIIDGSSTTVTAPLACMNARTCTWTAEPPKKSGRYEVSVRTADRATNTGAGTPSSIVVYAL